MGISWWGSRVGIWQQVMEAVLSLVGLCHPRDLVPFFQPGVSLRAILQEGCQPNWDGFPALGIRETALLCCQGHTELTLPTRDLTGTLGGTPLEAQGAIPVPANPCSVRRAGHPGHHSKHPHFPLHKSAPKSQGSCETKQSSPYMGKLSCSHRPGGQFLGAVMKESSPESCAAAEIMHYFHLAASRRTFRRAFMRCL